MTRVVTPCRPPLLHQSGCRGEGVCPPAHLPGQTMPRSTHLHRPGLSESLQTSAVLSVILRRNQGEDRRSQCGRPRVIFASGMLPECVVPKLGSSRLRRGSSMKHPRRRVVSCKRTYHVIRPFREKPGSKWSGVQAGRTVQPRRPTPEEHRRRFLNTRYHTTYEEMSTNKPPGRLHPENTTS